ncbi:hypothetical protein SAMN05892877_105293 [Rhizobium subbaraonis]|uniref:Uncharacterized protein n=1 Tax=Rhizobium subbaraonis TaxID=908946 RepID=A0A285UBR8_9HYPH|nr:hypothetical protein [Rhizobium subbaraonis]SOC38848.1 hypothetical protein SAMN05892877_105293 [Rhizobium subbaraonis]
MNGNARPLAQSSAVHMGVAFVAMGGWAILANRGHAPAQMLLAGAVQGAMSAAITLFLKKAIERLARIVTGAGRLWLPPALVIAVSGTALALIHRIAGTPEILRTIAVPLLVSASYAASYNYSLHRKEQGSP